MSESVQLTSEYDFSIAERFNVKFLKTDEQSRLSNVTPTHKVSTVITHTKYLTYKSSDQL
jgi:hypothetical protein